MIRIAKKSATPICVKRPPKCVAAIFWLIGLQAFRPSAVAFADFDFQSAGL
jgi:hypothetical protein